MTPTEFTELILKGHSLMMLLLLLLLLLLLYSGCTSSRLLLCSGSADCLSRVAVPESVPPSVHLVRNDLPRVCRQCHD